jgi:hypothetical protein
MARSLAKPRQEPPIAYVAPKEIDAILAHIAFLTEGKDRLEKDNAFLHQRRGELVIERDNAVKSLMEWSSGEGPNQELLLDASNAEMRAAIAEAAISTARAAAIEECAKIAEGTQVLNAPQLSGGGLPTGKRIAAAIRSLVPAGGRETPEPIRKPLGGSEG